MTLIELVPIGEIRTPYSSLDDCPRHGRDDHAGAVLEVFPQYEDALLDIESASHLHVLYWLDLAERSELVRKTPHDRVVRGVFAIRSPVRPNPIGLSVARLVRREGTRLTVSGLDCLDGTPLIDLKPYVPRHDRVEDATLTWHPG